MTISVPSWVEVILERLNQNGFESYIVGGCVRDALLGQVAKDFDVCTNALPEQIMACFSNMRTVPTGLQHGTVTVVSEGNPIEITTFRLDGDYTDCRHPDNVVFTDRLQDDLARRDFTVNAMAYHPRMGLIDLYQGQEDLKNKRIRCVGDPRVRFQEDALRVLRGLRFASVLGFAVEPETSSAMHDSVDLLACLAQERIYSELTKLLCGTNAKVIVECYQSVLRYVLPDIAEVNATTCHALSCVQQVPALRYAVLYRDHQNAAEIMTKLKAPKIVRQQVALLTQQSRRDLPKTLAETRQWVSDIGAENVKNTLILKKAFGEETYAVQAYFRQIEQKNLCCQIQQLAISGDDLIRLGYKKGRSIGNMLKQLLDEVIHERLENKTDVLIEHAKTKIGD